MLQMEQIYRIRNMKKFEGKSLRKIAKETGHDFQTVKKYVEKEDFNQNPRPKRKRQGKLSAYREIVITWLESDKKAPHKQQHTAKRVYDRLKELYPVEFDASDRSVRKFVSEIRKELQMDADGFLPLLHPPGEAQGDFGKARFVEDGIPYDGYYFNLSYPHSNGGYVQLFKSENQECLLEAMKKIFEHTGGTPTAIWFDNMSTAVTKIREYGKRDLSQGFLRFMLHYGFESNFCNPNSGHEKGSVENKVGYHRRNLFVPIPECKDLQAYNKLLLEKCEGDMERQHYKGLGLIKDLFAEDRKAFFPLPKIPFEVFRAEFGKADKYGKIRFDGRLYSTSPCMTGRQVMVKAGAYEIEMMNEEGHRIVKHPRLYGEETESMNWIPYLELMSRRPTALKYTGIYQQLPVSLQGCLDSSDYTQKKQLLRLLTKMTLLSGMDSAVAAFEESLRIGVRDPNSIWATYCRLGSASLPEPDMTLPDTVPELKQYHPDIQVYDQLLTLGGA